MIDFKCLVNIIAEDCKNENINYFKKKHYVR